MVSLSSVYAISFFFFSFLIIATNTNIWLKLHLSRYALNTSELLQLTLLSKPMPNSNLKHGARIFQRITLK